MHAPFVGPVQMAKWLVAVPSHAGEASLPQSETCTSTSWAGKSASEGPGQKVTC